MTESIPEAEVEATEAYEELFIPALFGEWAPRVSDAAELGDGERVLDVCGTGILAREAARRVGTSGMVAGLDPSPGMLAVAGRLAPTVDWRQGTAESPPYKDNSFDAVVSQFGLMLFEDRRRGDRGSLRNLFYGAGAHSLKVETHTGSARFPSARVMVEADLRGWLPSVGVVLPEDVFREILEEAEEALAPYVTPEGSVSFTTSAHIVTGRSE